MAHRHPPLPNPETTRHRLVDENEAADLLGLSKRTLQAWRVRGGGPPFLKLGRLVRYDVTMLWGWAASHVAENTSHGEG